MLILFYGVASEAHSKFLEYFAVHLAEEHGGVYLAAVEERQAGKRLAAVIVIDAEH